MDTNYQSTNGREISFYLTILHSFFIAKMKYEKTSRNEKC